MKSKTYTQSKQPLDKNVSSKFSQSGFKQTHFQNIEKIKGSDILIIHFKLSCLPWNHLKKNKLI